MKKIVAVFALAIVLFGIRIISPIQLIEPAVAEGDFVRNPSEINAAAQYTDGYYEGSAAAYNGDITVGVTVQKGFITGLKIVQTTDDKEYLDMAMSPILNAVLDKQDTSLVDAVSGATFSSYGILDAIDNALNQS